MKRLAMNLYLFLICLFAAASLKAEDLVITKQTFVPNPTGLQIGFWANESKQEGVVSDFGRRPIGREEFTGWDKIEKKPGVYDWGNTFSAYRRSHCCGESVIGSLNVAFTTEVVKAKRTIPDFYPGRISNPRTREAAKRFLYAYVQKLLDECGEMYLSIDYEIVFNYHLYTPKDLSNAQEWGAWYVEAAATMRKAAQDCGKSAQLKLLPIVNGDPLKEGNLFTLDPKKNHWLADVVNASDYLGLDCYHMGNAKEATDPSGTLDIIRFWMDNFSNGKDVIVCENGFTSMSTNNPGAKDEKGKYEGTEEEQKTYFENLFKRIQEDNQPEGAFHNKLRGFNIWSYMDNWSKKKGDYEIYFGMVRKDGTPKPVYSAVKGAISHIESDSFMRPYSLSVSQPVSPEEVKKGIPLAFRTGSDFESIEIKVKPGSGKNELVITTQTPSCVLLNVNGKWLSKAEKTATSFSFELSSYLKKDQETTVSFVCTGPVFPHKTVVTGIEFLQ
jgi:hypothetical protein